MNTTLIDIVNAFPNSLISCIGDIMLDVYQHGKTDRISPEAPVPVVNIISTQTMLGGLGNVVNNLNTLKRLVRFLRKRNCQLFHKPYHLSFYGYKCHQTNSNSNILDTKQQLKYVL